MHKEDKDMKKIFFRKLNRRFSSGLRGYLFLLLGLIILNCGFAESYAATLMPIRSFHIPVSKMSDPGIAINGLAYSDGKLFILNSYYIPGTQDSHGATIYALNPNNGKILYSFFAPDGSDLAADENYLYINLWNPEGDIIKIDSLNGTILQTIHPSDTIYGGLGGLSILNTNLYLVANTSSCPDLSITKIDPVTGTSLSCFSVGNTFTNPRALDADGTNLLFGTVVSGNFTVLTMSISGDIVRSDILSTVSDNALGIAFGGNQLFVADRRDNMIKVFSLSTIPAVAGCINLIDSPIANQKVILRQPHQKDKIVYTDDSGCYNFDTAVIGKPFQIIIKGPSYK
jgi:hypothetical protein